MTGGNGHKLKHEITSGHKNFLCFVFFFLIVSVVNHRNRLPREFIESPSLESQNPTGYDAALADPA